MKNRRTNKKCKYTPYILKEVNGLRDCMLDIALYNTVELNAYKAEYYLTNEAEPTYNLVKGLEYSEEKELIAFEFYDEIMKIVNKDYENGIPYEIIRTLGELSVLAWRYYTADEQFVEEVIQRITNK